MASGVEQYRIGYSRLCRAQIDGFLLQKDGSLTADAQRKTHSVFLGRIDSGKDDCAWGRLSFGAAIAGEAVLTVHAFASNDAVFLRNDSLTEIDGFLLSASEKKEAKAALFEAAGGIQMVNCRDMLLYELKGRYLWLWLEVEGGGETVVAGLRVLIPGDRFYTSFPSIYQKEGDFFHRYLSIFFSMYSDLQNEIDDFERYLNPDSAPADILPVFASWLGLELDGNFMDAQCLRKLIKLAPELNSLKGTRRAIELAVSLFVECPVYLVERNLLDRNQLAELGSMYGDTPYDFTLLLSCKANELLRERISFMIHQFKPVRSRASIIFLGDQGGFDSYSYLDTNAYLYRLSGGSLGEAAAQAGSVYLE